MARCRDELTVLDTDMEERDTHVVAEVDGQIAGFYALRICPGRECELDALFVAPDYIRAGIGRLLFMHARHMATARGAPTMRIHGDPHATGFYLAMGARRVGKAASGSVAGRDLPLFELRLRDES